MADVGLELSVFDLHVLHKDMLSALLLALDFFISEDVTYLPTKQAFVIHRGMNTSDPSQPVPENVVGYISRGNYQDVVDVIMQRCAVKTVDDIEEERPKFKNEKARLMWERQQAFLQRQREAESKANAEFFDLGNIISSLAYRQSGLNMINVWDMTVYNAYSQFEFERDGVVFDVSALSYSVWGADEKHKFDIDAWFKRKSPVSGSSDDLFSMAQQAKNR